MISGSGPETDFLVIAKNNNSTNWFRINFNGTLLAAPELEGDPTNVRTALAKNADVTHENRHGNTALIKASITGHAEVVKILLAKGCQGQS